MKKSILKKIVYTFVLFAAVQLFCSYKVSATTNSVPVNKEETLFSANAEKAEVLIKAGADTTIKNNDGQTLSEILFTSLDAKPILYFYPPEEIQVNVVLKNEQALTHTYPKYSQSWNVLAKPDGSLYDVNAVITMHFTGKEQKKVSPSPKMVLLLNGVE